MSTALDRTRLAKLLGMLGGADGEILNAARAVETLRRAAKLSWLEILTAAPDRPREDPELRRQVGQLLTQNDRLWDRIHRLEAQLKAARDDGPLRRHIDELGKVIARQDQRIDALEAENEALRKASFARPSENLEDVLCILVTWQQHLNASERGFVHDLIRHRKRRLSLKECATLADITSKIEFYRRQTSNGQEGRS